MDAKQAAAALDGNEYREEGSRELFSAMKAAGLVAAFTASDDLLEFRGAIYDEAGSTARIDLSVDRGSLYEPVCDSYDCPHEEAKRRSLPVVKADFDASPFTVTAGFPHETFTIVEDGEPYCRGIVFRLADMPEASQ